jgi:RIB43A
MKWGKQATAPDMATSLNVFNEDVYNALDANGRIIRRDHFKGFTPAQLRRLMQENELILQQKREQNSMDKESAKQWTIQQNMIARALEAANQEELMMKEQEKAHHLAVLRAQAQEKALNAMRARQQQMEPNRTDIGFYDGFGKSCR